MKQGRPADILAICQSLSAFRRVEHEVDFAVFDGVDDVRAFEMLRRLSQDGNIRLIEIARRVISTRGNS